MYPKTLVALLLTFSLVGVGCKQTTQGMPDESSDAGPSFSSGHTSSSRDIYKQWTIPTKETLRFSDRPIYFDESAGPDCIKVENGMTKGGDLLSSLIVDRQARATMPLNIYTQDYIERLERRLVSYTHRTYQADLYASSVCHIKDGLDVVTGYLWPPGKSTLQSGGKMDGQEHPDFRQRSGLFLVTDSSIAGVINEESWWSNRNKATIQLEDNTATGAETYACDATLESNNVRWTCFQGFHFVNDMPDGGGMASWLISLDGTVIEQKTWIEPFEAEPAP